MFYLDPQVVLELIEPLGNIQKLVPKARPYHNSCFVKMESVVDAGNVKRGLNGRIIKQPECSYIVEIKYFPPPNLSEK